MHRYLRIIKERKNMKNYYDILEVSSKASKEVIDKAYRVLIKKNHPDKHTPDIEKVYENYIKELNEAYEVLSNDFLREQYDKELELDRQKKIQEQTQNKEQQYYQTRAKKNINTSNNTQEQITESGIIGIIKLLFRKRTFGETRKKDKEEVKKDFIALGLTIVIIIVLGLILYFLPFTHDWMDENFIQNPLVQGIIKIFS